MRVIVNTILTHYPDANRLTRSGKREKKKELEATQRVVISSFIVPLELAPSPHHVFFLSRISTVNTNRVLKPST